jgi:hypothetical protein
MGAAPGASSYKKISKSLVRWGEGEGFLIKNNMLGDNNVVGREIETLITFVISGVSEEDTTSGSGANLWVACAERLG